MCRGITWFTYQWLAWSSNYTVPRGVDWVTKQNFTKTPTLLVKFCLVTQSWILTPLGAVQSLTCLFGSALKYLQNTFAFNRMLLHFKRDYKVGRVTCIYMDGVRLPPIVARQQDVLPSFSMVELFELPFKELRLVEGIIKGVRQTNTRKRNAANSMLTIREEHEHFYSGTGMLISMVRLLTQKLTRHISEPSVVRLFAIYKGLAKNLRLSQWHLFCM